MAASRSRKRFWLTAAMLAGGGCCAGYILYKSEYFAERRKKLEKLFGSVSALAETLYSGSEISATVARDLHDFLLSDSDEVPQSLRQVMKLSRCADFQVAVTRFSAAVTQGTLKGICATAPDLHAAFVGGAAPQESAASAAIAKSEAVDRRLSVLEGGITQDTLPERLLDKLFSEPGKSFASAVVGKAVRTLVHSYFEQASQPGRAARIGTRLRGTTIESALPSASFPRVSAARGGPELEDWLQPWLRVASSAKGKDIVSNIVSTFAISAVSVYLDKTSDMNMYEDMLSVVTKEEYKEPVTEILKTICSHSVESLVRTSHDVLTAEREKGPTHDESSSSTSQEAFSSSESSSSHTMLLTSLGQEKKNRAEQGSALVKGSTSTTMWQDEVGKLLTVPETRQLVLEVAGVMSAHGVRSFTAVFLDMLRSACTTKSLGEAGYSRGVSGPARPLGPFRAVAAKALTTASVCLALCLHLVTGTKTISPAGRFVNGIEH